MPVDPDFGIYPRILSSLACGSRLNDNTIATNGRGFTNINSRSLMLYRLLADLVVAVHLAFVGFVVLGMAAILLGIALKWRWVRNFWFRIIHLLMIAIVVEEEILGILCPLTEWEDRLRDLAGETVQEGTFLGRMFHNFIFWDMPPRVRTMLYCVFGLSVLAAFLFAPPRWPRGESSHK